jgi:hypothetical protein
MERKGGKKYSKPALVANLLHVVLIKHGQKINFYKSSQKKFQNQKILISLCAS